jgi:hypothetical protein
MYDILVDNKTLYNYEIIFVDIFSFLTKLVLFLFIIGFFEKKPNLFEGINFIVKIIYSVFIIYRFNSFRTQPIKFTELDRKVTLSCGIYILLISFIDLFNSDIEKIRNVITPYTKPMINKITDVFSQT